MFLRVIIWPPGLLLLLLLLLRILWLILQVFITFLFQSLFLYLLLLPLPFLSSLHSLLVFCLPVFSLSWPATLQPDCWFFM
mmetsp:Transcript_106624/g.301592  ORF Transcript_106624/g.301592 Transcript_106624/m.301592 type:complete len:81 (-) Transcript_106624:112-354(-)